MPRPDILVIGGGSIGLSCAVHVRAAMPGVGVTVLDSANLPGVASRAAAGMLVPFAEFDQDSPLFRLCCQSLAYYPAFLRKFGIDAPLDSAGTLIPFLDGEQDRTTRIQELASRHGKCHRMDHAELARAEPLLAGGLARGALWIPGSLVDPRRLHDGLVESARVMGIDFLSGAMARADVAGSRIDTIVTTAGKRLSPGMVVLATGAWSAEVGAALGLTAPIVPVKGQVARFDTDATALRHVVHTHCIYLAPRPGAGIVFGATMEEAGFDARVSDDTLAALRRAAVALAPGLAGCAIAETWVGFRPRFPDGLPAIGHSSRIQNLILATGHFRNGILLVPETGRLVAGLVREGATLPAEFLPARLGI